MGNFRRFFKRLRPKLGATPPRLAGDLAAVDAHRQTHVRRHRGLRVRAEPWLRTFLEAGAPRLARPPRHRQVVAERHLGGDDGAESVDTRYYLLSGKLLPSASAAGPLPAAVPNLALAQRVDHSRRCRGVAGDRARSLLPGLGCDALQSGQLLGALQGGLVAAVVVEPRQACIGVVCCGRRLFRRHGAGDRKEADAVQQVDEAPRRRRRPRSRCRVRPRRSFGA